MECYKANAVSRNIIRKSVRILKKSIGLENELEFPVLTFAENILPVIIPDYEFEVVPNGEMGTKHGITYPNRHVIRIREDIYLRAANGEGRDRLTIAHEIGHLFLHDNNSIALCRLAPGERLRAFEDPEWQANAFGGELLASSYLIRSMTVEEIVKYCLVSTSAAKMQLRTL